MRRSYSAAGTFSLSLSRLYIEKPPGDIHRWRRTNLVVTGLWLLAFVQSPGEELRRVGRENHATAGLVCPAHVKAAFNFEFDDIDIDVPMGEFLVEASKDTPRWRVMLTPLPGAAGEPDSHSTPKKRDKVI